MNSFITLVPSFSEYIRVDCNRTKFLAGPIRISELLPWDRKSYLTHAILPMLSYPGRQVMSSCEIASNRIQGLLESYFKINNK